MATRDRGHGHPYRDSPRPSANHYTNYQDEVEWDSSGGIGQWHKQPSNHGNEFPSNKSNHTGTAHSSTCNQGLLKSVNFSKSTEFVEIWDDQFDFCIKEEQCNDSESELNSGNSSPKSRRFSKAKCKEVFIRSKDYIKSKVAICKKKIHGHYSTSPKTNVKGVNSDLVLEETFDEQRELEDYSLRKRNQGPNLSPRVNVHIKSQVLPTKGHNSVEQEWIKYRLQRKHNCPTKISVGISTSDCPPMNGKVDKYKLNESVPSSMNGTSHTSQKNGTSFDHYAKDNYEVDTAALIVRHDVKEEGNDEKTSDDGGGTMEGTDSLMITDADEMPGLTKTPDNKSSFGDNSFEDGHHEDCGQHGTRPVDSCDVGHGQGSLEEDIPLGSEAHSFEIGFQEGMSLQNPNRMESSLTYPIVDKRLQWLMDSSHHQSFGSDFSQNTTTSNSSDISLDMILNERFESPEDILLGLGFGGNEVHEDPVQRIPDRFLSKPSSVEGLELSAILDDNPELSSLLQSYSMDQSGIEDLSQICNNQQKETGGSPEHLSQIINSVMHTMKFVSMAQPHKYPQSIPNWPSNSLHSSDDNQGIQSVLLPENREHLAKQGFYDQHKNQNGKVLKSPKTDGHRGPGVPRLTKSLSLDAAERRRMFQKSRTPREKSLSDLIESDEPKEDISSLRGREKSVDGDSDNTSNTQSFDNGFGHKTNFTSIETSTDSFDSTDSPSLYTTSSAHMHRGSALWLNAENVNTSNNPGCDWTDKCKEENEGISEIRMKQVHKLMSFDLDDGDYEVTSPSSPHNKQPILEKVSTHNQLRTKLSTKSSTCTLVGEDEIDFTTADTTASELQLLDDLGNEVKREKYDHDLDKEVQGLCEVSKTTEHEQNVTDSIDETSQGKLSDVKICDSQEVKCDKPKDEIDVLTYYFRPGVKSTTKDRSTQVSSTTAWRGQQEIVTECHDSKDLGGVGRMESIQSDSSGFADGDVCDQTNQENLEKVSSLGSSAESDQTFHSSSTLLPCHDQSTSPGLPASDSHKQFINTKQPAGQKKMVSRVDVAVGTEDFEEIEQPSNKTSFVTYHVHQRERNQRETTETSCEMSDSSVVLTIELPREWLNTSSQRSEVSVSSSSGEKRVVSHLYKVIAPPTTKKDNNSNVIKTTQVDVKMSEGDNLNNGANQNQSSRNRLEDNQMYSDMKSSKIIDFIPNPFVRPIQPTRASTPRTSSRISHRKLWSESPRQNLNLGQFAGSDDGRASLGIEMSGISSSVNNYQYGSGRNLNFDRQQELHPLADGDQSSVFSVSMDSDSSSLQDDHIEYIKLMRLINKSVSFKKETRGTNHTSKFKPKFNIKTWTSIQKLQQVQEETRLMQNALQRYKAELNVLETTFLVNSQLAAEHLTMEERLEVEELQCLYGEVRQEIMEMEQFLYKRASGSQMGNDNFSPLLVLEVIQKMIDIIKEQIYQQQVNVYREDTGLPSDSDPPFQSSQSNVPWWPEVSQQLWEIQQKVSQPTSLHSSRQCVSDSLTELRTSILDEVKQELRSSTQWLHRELEMKERELSRLRSEYVSGNIKTGETRVRQFYETDV